MKNLFILILTVMISISQLSAENVIEVRRFNQWAHEYLTVTNNWNGLFVTLSSGELPSCMAVVTSINGQSTKEMSTNTFYSILGSNKEIKLDYLEKDNGTNKSKSCVFTSRENCYWVHTTQSPMGKPRTVTMVSDSEVDFFDYNTFDYVVEGNDKLTDKEIMDALCDNFVNRGLKRDKENPDLIFKLTKNFQQHSNSTYVPEQSHVVNTGASAYTWRDKKGNIHTNVSSSNQMITTGGYTKTTNSSELHCLFFVYDGKKYRQDSDSDPVWKLDFTYFYMDFVDMLSTIKSDVGYYCNNYPFTNNMFSYSLKTTGVAFESPEAVKTGVIKDVLEGTDAWKKGFRPGYTITKAYASAVYFGIGFFPARTYFKANSKRSKYWALGFEFVPIPFGTKHRADYLTNTDLRAWGTKMYFKYTDMNGKKKKARAPFEMSDYNYEYIK